MKEEIIAQAGGPPRPSLCLTPESELPSMANTCITYRDGVKVDIAWTKYRFSEICWLLLNGNDYKFFLQVYQDANGKEKFARNKTARADHREEWAWNTITGRAKTPVGIGFYPTNINSESRWGAMDFDAHGSGKADATDNEKAEAHSRAHAAFDVLKRHCQHRLLLGTSGGGGWHLFVFASGFHKIGEWIRFLEEVALRVRVPIRKGSCEIFPGSTRGRHGGGGIRAPGTWNPKNGQFGLLFEDQVSPALDKLALCGGERREVVSFLYHGTAGHEAAQFTDKGAEFTDKGQEGRAADALELALLHAVGAEGTRRDKLKELIGETFRSWGRELVRQAAELQHRQATPRPDASLDEHLAEFERLWTFFCDLWRTELSPPERQKVDQLTTQNERDFVRIVYGFAQLSGAGREFPVACAHLARRIGITFKGIAKIRRKCESLGIIRKTAECVTNKFAARYVWIADENQVLEGNAR